MITAIIPVFNRVESTMRCLDSLLSQEMKPLRVVVVDDGSTDGTEEQIREIYPEVTILKGSGEMYWTGSVQFGINHVLSNCSDDDWVILINNDVIVSEESISKLIEFAVSKDRNAIVSALSLDSKDKDTVIKSGTVVESWMLNITKHIYGGSKYSQLADFSPIEADLLTGRCLLHPVEVFQAVGNYDGERFPHYGGDDEFTARAKRRGYNLYVVPESIVFLDTKTTGNTESIWSGGMGSIWHRFFGIKSNINIVTKWKFTMSCVPFYAIPSYYFVAVLKSIYIFLKSK